MTTSTLLVVPALLGSLLLAGCSSGSAGGLVIMEQYRGFGEVVDEPSADGSTHSVISWLDGGRGTVSLTTWGSGSCPNIPIALHVASSTDVTLTMKRYSSPCTSDLAPTTSEFSLPSGVSRTRSVSVSLDVPGRDAPERLTLAVAPGGRPPAA